MQTKTNPTKDRLIKAGAEAMLLKSYHAVGIQEILATTDVPKGSFYYYFKSKEEFAQAIIEYQAAKITADMEHRLSETLSPRRKLKEYFRMIRQDQVKTAYTYPCLLAKLAAELGDTIPTIRQTVKDHLNKRLEIIAECIIEAERRGETEPALDPLRTAETIYMAWEGALIKSCIDQTASALDTFINHTIDKLLPERQTTARRQEAPL